MDKAVKLIISNIIFFISMFFLFSSIKAISTEELQQFHFAFTPFLTILFWGLAGLYISYLYGFTIASKQEMVLQTAINCAIPLGIIIFYVVFLTTNSQLAFLSSPVIDFIINRVDMAILFVFSQIYKDISWVKKQQKIS